MTSSREKFQQLLRELFQFDCADLDFGIYRIMNYKRDVIEKFITQDLPEAIAEDLDRGALAVQSQAARELKEVVEQITRLDKGAIDADENLAKFQDTDIGRKYLDLKAKAAEGRGCAALETSIFNHLYTFFSRYYQDGDFISKRRYSKRQKYAIPYNGEEVYLYWANNDQYYVKTAEHFHDYTFTSRGLTVHFKLMAADVEQNNVKGDKRFFLPRVKAMEWDEDSGQLVIPFEYCPLTGQEEIAYGKKNQQKAIIAETLTEIPKRLKKAHKALAVLTAERRKDSDGKSVTFLEHHLRQYTRRNTSDFFIHKDLKGFLSRELDFYLKNEVLNLDEMESAGEDRAESWFQLMRVIKAVGIRIIEFLDQIECFQKMLWEKRKFITETQYCITVGSIDEGFYPDITVCEPLWDEWKELFHIDELEGDMFSGNLETKKGRIAFLKAHSTLVLDTRHFDADFVDKLLASFNDLDEMTDGLLIHSENWQALNLQPLLTPGSVFFVSCDDNENARLKECLNRVFTPRNFESQIIIQSNKRGQTYKSIAKTHEYLLVYDADESTTLNGLPRDIKSGERDEYGHYELWELRNRNPKFGRFNRPNLFYPIYISAEEYDQTGYSCVSVKKTDHFRIQVYPRNSSGQDSCWRWSLQKVKAASQEKDKVLIAKQVRFTPEWKDGKPKRMVTPEEAGRSPRIVKYIRLESYEDALNNIEFDDATVQQVLRFDDYVLRYMLKWETKISETLLNVEKLARPFTYKLHIHENGQTSEKVADISETFNYLLGLNVQTRRVYDDKGRRYLVYSGRINHRKVVIIWRKTDGWEKADYERDKKFVADQKLTDSADEVFVNGDSFLSEVKALEPVFKARMFDGVES